MTQEFYVGLLVVLSLLIGFFRGHGVMCLLELFFVLADLFAGPPLCVSPALVFFRQLVDLNQQGLAVLEPINFTPA